MLGLSHVGMKTSEKYAQRAAQRLNALLDQQGAAVTLLERSNVLADALNLPATQTRQMLGGLVSWTWAQLDKTCTVFGKEPGYFLDQTSLPGIPADTKVAQSADGGELIVVRPPLGFIKRAPDPRAEWCYGTQHRSSAFIPQGSLVLYTALGMGEHLHAGLLYAIEGPDGLDFMRCTAVHEAVAGLDAGSADGTSRMLPVSVGSGDIDSIGPRIVGQVFASITAH